MEEYLNKLLLQVRCKKARPYIEDEIRGHIESQIEDNIASGMEQDEAERNAVKDMGDPISAGISLDKIHGPQIAWRLLIAVGILSVLGILIQVSYRNSIINFVSEISDGTEYWGSLREYIASVIVGIILMLAIYFIDYTTIAKYSKLIGVVIIVVGASALIWGKTINGANYYISFLNSDLERRRL